ncbi:MAG: head-tail joining protein [Endozoicomonas sp.]|uniref:head-tail joining protein n=1 Tax=Endozoicomonas sp. TaxID=1892382 RepID=UPI003D9B9A69
MQDELNDLNRQILSTFGQPVTILKTDDSALKTTGILSSELIPAGQYEQVLQPMTVLALAESIPLKRGDQVVSEGQQWTVDRKVKSDGTMIWWHLHETGT